MGQKSVKQNIQNYMKRLVIYGEHRIVVQISNFLILMVKFQLVTILQIRILILLEKVVVKKRISLHQLKCLHIDIVLVFTLLQIDLDLVQEMLQVHIPGMVAQSIQDTQAVEVLITICSHTQ